MKKSCYEKVCDEMVALKCLPIADHTPFVLLTGSEPEPL